MRPDITNAKKDSAGTWQNQRQERGQLLGSVSPFRGRSSRPGRRAGCHWQWAHQGLGPRVLWGLACWLPGHSARWDLKRPSDYKCSCPHSHRLSVQLVPPTRASREPGRCPAARCWHVAGDTRGNHRVAPGPPAAPSPAAGTETSPWPAKTARLWLRRPMGTDHMSLHAGWGNPLPLAAPHSL